MSARVGELGFVALGWLAVQWLTLGALDGVTPVAVGGHDHHVHGLPLLAALSTVVASLLALMAHTARSGARPGRSPRRGRGAALPAALAAVTTVLADAGHLWAVADHHVGCPWP